VFTILSAKHVTISLEIKLCNKTNLSNGKGDNSTIWKTTVNSVLTAQSAQFSSFTVFTTRIRLELKQVQCIAVSQLSNGYLNPLT
jgi:hypothetical protein